tara:strand:+ start:1729 stop:2085 length:357 start_codon:yes stop_codon:yes gene_type:complete
MSGILTVVAVELKLGVSGFLTTDSVVVDSSETTGVSSVGTSFTTAFSLTTDLFVVFFLAGAFEADDFAATLEAVFTGVFTDVFFFAVFLDPDFAADFPIFINNIMYLTFKWVYNFYNL